MCDVGALKLFQGIGGRPGGVCVCGGGGGVETIKFNIRKILLVKKTFYACQNLP